MKQAFAKVAGVGFARYQIVRNIIEILDNAPKLIGG
jgi:hypothetical protein